jgi:hypothetical protein
MLRELSEIELDCVSGGGGKPRPRCVPKQKKPKKCKPKPHCKKKNGEVPV